MIARFNYKNYKIVDSIEIKKSSREVTYTDLTLDFSECTFDDLPLAQQEIQIIDKENNLIFTGFVSDFELPELKKIRTSNKELKLSLFSPRQLTTKRTITVTRTALLSDILSQVLSPLYEDGFTLKTLQIEDKSITLNLISRTIEEVLNYLSNKYSLYWNINELKEIEIISINYLLKKEATKSININNYKNEIQGLISISPSIENTDYANIINVKNARIFYSNTEDNTNLNITLKKGDRLDFENPIDISEKTARRITGTLQSNEIAYCQSLKITYNTNQEAQIFYNFTGEKTDKKTNDIATDDKEGNKFVLTLDSMFNNLATGLTYKGENDIIINKIQSQTYLRYASMKLINWHEVEKMAGIVTPSGQIEKVVDLNESWFTFDELVQYIRNTFLNNEKYTNEIKISYDKPNNIDVGDRIDIDLPEYFISGSFLVTAINENKSKNNPTNYEIELRNTNFLENYINLFRSSSDIEEQDQQTEVEYVVEYAEEESIVETHKIYNEEANNNEN